MKSAWKYVAVAAVGATLAALWPITPALASREAVQVRVTCGVITVVACVTIALVKDLRALVWMTVAIAASTGGLAMLLMHAGANASCVVENYPGGPTIVGRDLTSDALEYVRKTGTGSSLDLLLDAGGNPERVWTAASIARCRFWVGWGGLLAVPLFAACVAGLIARRSRSYIPTRTFRSTIPSTAPPGAVAAPVFDAFVSYRHTEPDTTHATELMQALESHGLRVAIDFRDFRPNEHFLTEMERCIRESRFVLCVITAKYLESDNCSEEAIISKTLDMSDRRKRIVPLVFDRVTLPVWLHGLVGIDFSQRTAIDPFERLMALLGDQP